MSRRTALIALALLVLLCARSPAWRDDPPVPVAPLSATHVTRIGDPALGWISVCIEVQLAPALERWLKLFLERDGS